MLRVPALSLLLALLLAPACQHSGRDDAAVPGPEPELAAPTADEADASQSKGIGATAIVAATDRDPADVESDVRRKLVELLEFLGLEPGMKVADIGAGFGYTTELLAGAG